MGIASMTSPDTGAAAEERADHTAGGPAVAERFARAVTAADYKQMYALLAPDVRFRYLVPSGPAELVGAADVAAKYFDWFGDAEIHEVQRVLVDPLPDRVSVRYRMRLHRRDRWEVVEQQSYVDHDERGRISAIDLLCSGFGHEEGPEEEPEGEEEGVVGTHRFDAGTLSCADGLARQFRRRILAIPAGDVLVVETMDPAAKEDLPPLARMMGHKVLSVEPSDGGRLRISVERGR